MLPLASIESHGVQGQIPSTNGLQRTYLDERTYEWVKGPHVVRSAVKGLPSPSREWGLMRADENGARHNGRGTRTQKGYWRSAKNAGRACGKGRLGRTVGSG